MALQFSSSETISLEKQVKIGEKNIVSTNKECLNEVYDISKCLEWIKSHNFKKVCLQFPDHLLQDSSEVALRLQEDLHQVVYIMGDTAYESCCIDYIAAAHVDADAIIHYGPVCFSKATGNVPCMYVYEKHPLDLSSFIKAIEGRFTNVGRPHIILDTPYISHLDSLRTNGVITSSIVDDFSNVSSPIIFLGNHFRKITNFYYSFKPVEFFYYDPSVDVPEIVEFQENLQVRKRRLFLIEKVKDSQTFGIVIGTVAVKNYLRVIERVKRLISASKKKYYVISVGKPTVAKLANFPEIDIYVIITCAMNQIYDSRDFYKPIVSPYDIESALNPFSRELQFSYDFNSYLPDDALSASDFERLSKLEQNDVSLLTGKMRNHEVVDDDLGDNRVALKNNGTVSVKTFGSGYLAGREWRGLEQNLGGDEPELASEGRCGLAAGYANES